MARANLKKERSLSLGGSRSASEADTETDDEAPPIIKNEVKDEDEEKALAILRESEHPRFIVKKEEQDLPISATVAVALRDNIPTYVLSPAQEKYSDIDVSRAFMSQTFGGNPQETFPTIGKKMAEKHDFRDFMYLSKDYNPLAPTKPGKPGLFFSSEGAPNGTRSWTGTRKRFRVITRLSENHWLYVGQYRLSFARLLTSEEWQSQAVTVRNTWVTNMAERSWGLPVRALLADQLGRQPTADEVSDKLMEAKEANDNIVISEELIQQALLNGAESIMIWNMTCVDYDAEFQRILATKSKPTTRNIPVEPVHKVEDEENTIGGKSKAVTSARKRKRTETNDQEDLSRTRRVSTRLQVKNAQR